MPYKYGVLNQKPPRGGLIDWSNPLASQLRVFVPFNEDGGRGLINYANNYQGNFVDSVNAVSDNYEWGADQGGKYAKSISAADALLERWHFPSSTFYDNPGVLSWGVRTKFQATNNARCFGRFNNATNANDFGIGALNGTQWYTYVETSGGNNYATVASQGGIEFIIATYDGVTIRAYINGNPIATQALTGVPNNNNGDIFIANWRYVVGSPIRWLQPIYATYMWGRVLSQSEIQSLYVSPYQLLYVPRKYIFAASTVVPLTLSASDQIGTMLDAQSNTGTALGALSRSDQMVMSDAIALIGGNPDFQLILSDNLNHLADQLQNVVPVLLLALSDSLNNLNDSAVKTFGFPIAVFDSNQFNWSDVVTQLLAGFLQQNPSDSMNNLADAASVSLLNVPFLVAVSDTLNNLNDAVRLWNLLRLATGDQMVLSDAQRGRMAHLMRLADVLSTFLELVQKSFVNQPSFSDQMSLTDDVSMSMAANLTATASDTLSMTDAALVAMAGNYNPGTLIDRIKRYLNDPQ